MIPLLVLLLLAAGSAGLYIWLAGDLPSPEIQPAHLQPPSVRITDRDGRLLYESLPSVGGRHQELPLAQIPLALQQATIATEDASFYHNPGVDLAGILRAAWINLRGGETLAGGSTITQQVARNLLMDERERGERSLRRKLRESLLAWQLTRRYSKADILALYLNQSYYGGLAYGVEAAARTYFGRPLDQLSLAECALLAGLPQAPAAYNPFASPQAALDRRATVLGLMEKAGYLTTAQRALAEREPLNLAVDPYPMQAPHFSLMIKAQVDALFTPEQIAASGGLVVRTTLNLDAQHTAEAAIQHQMEKLREKGSRGLGYNVNNAALVAIDPRSGQILAMVGSPDAQDQQHSGAINMTLAPRQPGSALKPLIYAAAFDPTRPDPWTPATSILDVQTHFVTHDDLSYTPANYDNQEHGPVSARQALASSLNIPAVLTLQKIGLPALFDLGGRVGLAFHGSPADYDLSLALGGGEVTLLDLTTAYGAFATGGYRVAPYSLLEVRDGQGRLLYQHAQAAPRRALDERVAWLITDILSDDSARQVGFGLHSILNIDRPAAVKTGTTTNFHDNWAVGYTPELVMGVWVGNASHEGMREVNGLTGAAPIWHEAMRALLSGQPESAFARPPGLVQAEVCALSGKVPTPDCPYRRLEWFIQGTQPVEKDTLYRTVLLDSATGQLASAATPAERRVPATALDLPPAAQNWAHARGLLLWSDLHAGQPAQAANAAAAPTSSAPALALLSPADLSIYQIAANLPLSAQRIPIQAALPLDLTGLTLYVDGQPLATAAANPTLAWWQLRAGRHEAWATAQTSAGEVVTSSRVRFEVKDTN